MKPSKNIDIGILALRIVLGCLMTFYGSQKVLGLFGGPGYATMLHIYGKMGIPPALGILSMCAEFLGGLGILTGTLTRIAAFGVTVNMSVALYESVSPPGEMHKVLTGGGTDAWRLWLPMIVGASALAILFIGAGAFSIDNALFKKRRR